MKEHEDEKYIKNQILFLKTVLHVFVAGFFVLITISDLNRIDVSFQAILGIVFLEGTVFACVAQLFVLML